MVALQVAEISEPSNEAVSKSCSKQQADQKEDQKQRSKNAKEHEAREERRMVFAASKSKLSALLRASLHSYISLQQQPAAVLFHRISKAALLCEEIGMHTTRAEEERFGMAERTRTQQNFGMVIV